jgi:AGZA family xanthine/uracil permease-like MFS transporter
MHGYAFTPADTVIDLSPAWPWATGYAVMALAFVSAQFLTEPHEGPGH